MPNSEYQYQRSRTEKIRTMGCIICVLVLLCIPYVIFGVKANIINIITEILSSIVGLLVVFLCWEIAKNRRDEEAHDKYMCNLIMRIMEHEPDIINKLYSNYSADKVLKNCLVYYNKNLADSFLRYFKGNMASYRTGLNYRVEIGEKKIIDGSPMYKQTQIVSYSRHFKVKEVQDEYSFQCFFAIKQQLLEKRMNESIWFFREIITDAQLIKLIKENIKDKDKIISLIQLKMSLGNPLEILPSSVINMDPCYDNKELIGFSFKASIKPQNFRFTPDKPDARSGYVSYLGKISFALNSANNFYCVFPEPCLKPKFSIRFNESIELTTVERVTCLSIPPTSTDDELRYAYEETNPKPFNLGYRWIDENQRMTLDVDNDIYILPRSGVYFTW